MFLLRQYRACTVLPSSRPCRHPVTTSVKEKLRPWDAHTRQRNPRAPHWGQCPPGLEVTQTQASENNELMATSVLVSQEGPKL